MARLSLSIAFVICCTHLTVQIELYFKHDVETQLTMHWAIMHPSQALPLSHLPSVIMLNYLPTCVGGGGGGPMPIFFMTQSNINLSIHSFICLGTCILKMIIHELGADTKRRHKLHD
jgi:hypothetical protein